MPKRDDMMPRRQERRELKGFLLRGLPGKTYSFDEQPSIQVRAIALIRRNMPGWDVGVRDAVADAGWEVTGVEELLRWSDLTTDDWSGWRPLNLPELADV